MVYSCGKRTFKNEIVSFKESKKIEYPRAVALQHSGSLSAFAVAAAPSRL